MFVESERVESLERGYMMWFFGAVSGNNSSIVQGGSVEGEQVAQGG